MKYEALKHQSSTLRQDNPKIRTSQIIGNETGEGGKTIRRYVRLTELIPELLELIDKKIAFLPAVELSYLKDGEQYSLLLLNIMTLLRQTLK